MADPYVSIVQESRRPLTADDVQEIHADRTGQWPELREISNRLMAAMLRGDIARVGHVRGPGGKVYALYARVEPLEVADDLRTRLIRAGWRPPGQARRY